VDKVVGAGMTEARGKCIRQFARIVKKNVKSHLNLGKIVRFIARIAFQSTKIAAADPRLCRIVQRPVSLIPVGPFLGQENMIMKMLHGLMVLLLMGAAPVFAQESESSNDIITKMQHDLNLSDDQVSNITQVIERYTIASSDLQQSIEDGTINPSAVDSQKQQIKAAEDQGIAQYLRPDQLYQWHNIQGQMDRQKDKEGSDSDAGADEYSNLPKHNPS
jgi:hypothetical protein